MSDSQVVITAEHVRRAQAVAVAMAREGLGRYAGRDELVSQSLVALWECALSFDKAHGLAFNVYLQVNVRHRLHDWLRVAYGRILPDGSAPAKMAALCSMTSLDEHRPEDEREHPALVDSSPSVEDVVCARDELRQLGKLLKEMTSIEARSLTWPVREETPQQAADALDSPKATLTSTRWHMKKRAARAIGRPYEPRTYRRDNCVA